MLAIVLEHARDDEGRLACARGVVWMERTGSPPDTLARMKGRLGEGLLARANAELAPEVTGRGKLKTAAAIGVRVGKVVNKYKVAKHFALDIRDDGFDFRLDEENVAAEAALDGIYVVRTSVPREGMSADDAVRNYKNLSRVERAFRTFKSVDLKVRPIHHRVENRVRAHILLCMLAYYVEWHMREAWRPLLFADEDQDAKLTRNPVAPAKRSRATLAKVTPTCSRTVLPPTASRPNCKT